jgi:hypothetical protein
LEDEKINGRKKFKKGSWVQFYTFHSTIKLRSQTHICLNVLIVL